MNHRAALTLAIVVLSQVAWFACVLGAARGNGWIGPVVVAATLALTALLLGNPRATMGLALLAGLIGLILESMMLASGLVRYAAPGPLSLLPPAWLLGLWVVFSVLPNTALSWLHGRLLLQVMLALVGAPLAYLGGASLGAMTFSEPTAAGLVAIGGLWAVAFPMLMAGAARFNHAPKAAR